MRKFFLQLSIFFILSVCCLQDIHAQEYIVKDINPGGGWSSIDFKSIAVLGWPTEFRMSGSEMIAPILFSVESVRSRCSRSGICCSKSVFQKSRIAGSRTCSRTYVRYVGLVKRNLMPSRVPFGTSRSAAVLA